MQKPRRGCGSLSRLSFEMDRLVCGRARHAGFKGALGDAGDLSCRQGIEFLDLTVPGAQHFEPRTLLPTLNDASVFPFTRRIIWTNE